jgi:hypothetical protein
VVESTTNADLFSEPQPNGYPTKESDSCMVLRRLKTFIERLIKKVLFWLFASSWKKYFTASRIFQLPEFFNVMIHTPTVAAGCMRDPHRIQHCDIRQQQLSHSHVQLPALPSHDEVIPAECRGAAAPCKHREASGRGKGKR